LSSPRQEIAKQRIRDRLADIPRHLAALDAAIALFEPDFDPALFRAASASSDPAELAKANQLQAAFENTHNHLIGLAQGIVELEGWAPDRSDALTALRKLKEHGVISEPQRRAIHDAQVIRNAIQHSYTDVAADELREAALSVKATARAYIGSLIELLQREGVVRAT
jgi:uncharacterized protein YutE (UPF0331/DUF86 family)